jgi:hypothetical protein
MDSTIGTARGTTQGSCRPRARSSVSSPGQRQDSSKVAAKRCDGETLRWTQNRRAPSTQPHCTAPLLHTFARDGLLLDANCAGWLKRNAQHYILAIADAPLRHVTQQRRRQQLRWRSPATSAGCAAAAFSTVKSYLLLHSVRVRVRAWMPPLRLVRVRTAPPSM